MLIPVTDNSSIGEVRRAVLARAEAIKFNQNDAGRAAIVATELATNLARHAQPAGRTIILRANHNGTASSLEITSIDSGPGISDVSRSMEDGYSTGGTPGNGLGAIRRMSDQFDLFTSAGGTVFWACIFAGGDRARLLPAAGAISMPVHGETLCGDSWRIFRAQDGRIALMIADGLGHGPLAADASNAACEVFDGNPFADPSAMLANMHSAISSTRGAAVAVAQINPATGVLNYVGVGNISGTLLAADGSTRGLFSHNGTVGHAVRKIQAFEYPWSPANLLVLYSDGLQSRWSLEKYPGLSKRHAAVIAGVLFRDFRRSRDDVTVLTLSSSQPMA
jgi:anti-sigma regulatory factor (Ser/Thr protein kinase)